MEEKPEKKETNDKAKEIINVADTESPSRSDILHSNLDIERKQMFYKMFVSREQFKFTLCHKIKACFCIKQ